MKTNRYLVATCGVLLHLMIGSVYAWSVFNQPIAAVTGFSESQISFAFSLAIFCLGMSAAFMGQLVERFSPRAVGMLASACFGSGMMLTGLAIATKQLWLLYLGYGVIGGIGLGAGYVTPVSTIIKWFPDHRGLATGLAIMGFGFAALLTSPLAQFLINHTGVVRTFYLLGVIYFAVMMLAAQFIKKPTTNDLAKLTVTTNSNRKYTLTNRNMTANAAVKTTTFWSLWVMFFINITCGIALVSAASPMAQQITHMSADTAAMMVGIIGLFNGFGRLFWATLSDYLGRRLTFSVIFVVDVLMFAIMLTTTSDWWFIVALCLTMSCYGAGFAVIPAYLDDVFGTKQLGAIHGYVLTAWAAAGMVGPVILSFSHELFHTYTTTLVVFIFLAAVALITSILVFFQINRMKTPTAPTTATLDPTIK